MYTNHLANLLFYHISFNSESELKCCMHEQLLSSHTMHRVGKTCLQVTATTQTWRLFALLTVTTVYGTRINLFSPEFLRAATL